MLRLKAYRARASLPTRAVSRAIAARDAIRDTPLRKAPHAAPARVAFVVAAVAYRPRAHACLDQDRGDVAIPKVAVGTPIRTGPSTVGHAARGAAPGRVAPVVAAVAYRARVHAGLDLNRRRRRFLDHIGVHAAQAVIAKARMITEKNKKKAQCRSLRKRQRLATCSCPETPRENVTLKEVVYKLNTQKFIHYNSNGFVLVPPPLDIAEVDILHGKVSIFADASPHIIQVSNKNLSKTWWQEAISKGQWANDDYAIVPYGEPTLTASLRYHWSDLEWRGCYSYNSCQFSCIGYSKSCIYGAARCFDPLCKDHGEVLYIRFVPAT